MRPVGADRTFVVTAIAAWAAEISPEERGRGSGSCRRFRHGRGRGGLRCDARRRHLDRRDGSGGVRSLRFAVACDGNCLRVGGRREPQTRLPAALEHHAKPVELVEDDDEHGQPSHTDSRKRQSPSQHSGNPTPIGGRPGADRA